jgi:sugar phosphate isomerase/epimerase
MTSTIPIALSSGSVFPASTESAFEIAADLGYDGIEVMVGGDPVSQDPTQWKALIDRHQVPVMAVHVPCLLLTQTVWGTEPWGKIRRTVAAAEEVGAGVIVLHPPFRWQREYARTFIDGLRAEQDKTEVKIAVENMYPWGRVRHQRFTKGREVELEAYRPSWNLRDLDVDHATVDLSHTAASRDDALDLARHLGSRLTHVHLADGTGVSRDEHLIPGRGSEPCAEFLQHLVATDYSGTVVVEVSTRSSTIEQRAVDLKEAIDFTRTHLTGTP